MEEQALYGVIAATPTPLDAAGKPDCERLIDFIRHLLKEGCHGVNLLGTTGEATSFDVATRVNIMETVAQHSDLLPHMMVGTGAASIDDTIELTAVADALGYRGALLLPPFYYKDLASDALRRTIGEVAEKVAPSRLRFYLYNFPQLTGLTYSEEVVAALFSDLGLLLAGLKDSSGNLAYAERMASCFPRLSVFPSNEAVLSRPREDGFAGCISASVNVAPKLARQVFDEEGRQSDVVSTMNDVRAAVSSVPLVPAVKFSVGLVRKDPAWTRTKLPLTALSLAQRDSLVGRLATLGVI